MLRLPMLLRRRRAATALPALAVVLMAASAAAHHSVFAEYDRTQTVEFAGTLTAMHFVNPHVWYFFEQKRADGSKIKWAIEAGAPSQMRRVFLEQFHKESLDM